MASVVHYPGQRLLRAALWAFAIVIFLVQLAPLFVLIPLSFTSGTLLNFPIPSFSLRWYGEFFGSAQWLGSLRNTFVVGVVASTLATILGTLGAISVAEKADPEFVRRAVREIGGALQGLQKLKSFTGI